jgi:hypothetical protein
VAKLVDVIKGRINVLVAQGARLTDENNKAQAVIASAIAVEEARLKSMENYLEMDLEDVKKEFTTIFEEYSADAPRVITPVPDPGPDAPLSAAKPFTTTRLP